MKLFTSGLILLCMVRLAVSQTAEPGLTIDFIAAEQRAGEISGSFEVEILPPDLYGDDADIEAAVPALLRLEGRLFSGDWLVQTDTIATDEEAFVLAKFHAFREFESAQQYRDLLDAETFVDFERSIAQGRIDLATDREIYAGYDDIRLLGSIRYGVYTLLYTQFREAATGRAVNSVMPVRSLEGGMRTAGSMHANSHALYRMLTMGTVQRQLMTRLEQLTGD